MFLLKCNKKQILLKKIKIKKSFNPKCRCTDVEHHLHLVPDTHVVPEQKIFKPAHKLRVSDGESG